MFTQLLRIGQLYKWVGLGSLPPPPPRYTLTLMCTKIRTSGAPLKSDNLCFFPHVFILFV